MGCKYKNIVHRPILYVAKTNIICCKDKMYMLQRQILYVINAKLYVIETKCICNGDKFVCYKDEQYML